MTFDPTTNRVPWYLLTDEEKAAMQAWPHGFECGFEYGASCVWKTVPKPSWSWATVYRAKPKPVVTSTWQNIYPDGVNHSLHKSRTYADRVGSTLRIAILRRDTVNGVTTAHLEDL